MRKGGRERGAGLLREKSSLKIYFIGEKMSCLQERVQEPLALHTPYFILPLASLYTF